MDEDLQRVIDMSRSIFHREELVDTKKDMSKVIERYMSEGYRVSYKGEDEALLKKGMFTLYLAGAVVMLLLTPFISLGSVFMAGLVLLAGLSHGYKKTVRVTLRRG